ncbi:LysE family transporter [Aneurinibacillus sp. Ricciae_BoGa-3]|uniref:LysE family transporter n=1 Tax=Aneurinibacillus sp. Ricciae_BoGa-3 TaxID=3022697 RepID=UPI003FA47BBC
MSNLLNPKAVIFFFTFIPQFIVTGQNTFLQILLFGFTLIFLGLIWLLFYVYSLIMFASGLPNHLFKAPSSE